MASAYGILRQYPEWIPPSNLDLLYQGLAYKEGKYDANRLKAEETLASIANIDLIKDVDKIYLQGKLQGLVDEVNKFGKIDFSNNGLTRNIQNYVSGSLDETVMNAYITTTGIRSREAEVADVKKNRPQDYAIQNEEDAFTGLQEYLENPNVGVKYRTRSYSAYVDYGKTLDDMIKNADKYLVNIQKKTSINGTHYFEDEYQEFVDPDKLRNMIRTKITPQMGNQIRMDAKYKYKGIAEEDFKGMVNESYSTQIDSLNKVKQLSEAELAGIDSKDPKHSQIKGYIDTVGGKINELQSYVGTLDTANLEQLQTGFLFNNIENGYINTYSGVIRQERTLRENSIPLKIADLEEKIRHNSVNESIKTAEFNLKQQEFTYKQQRDIALDQRDSVAMEGVNPPTTSEETRFYENLAASKQAVDSGFNVQFTEDLNKEGNDQIFLATYGKTKEQYKKDITSMGESRAKEESKIYLIDKIRTGYDSKMVKVDPNFETSVNNMTFLDQKGESTFNDKMGSIDTELNTAISSIYNGTADKALSNLKVRNFTIKTGTDGKQHIQLLPGTASFKEVYGGKEGQLDKEIGKTGKTLRDLLQTDLASQLFGGESSKLINKNSSLETYADYINYKTSGTRTESNRGDSGSAWTETARYFKHSVVAGKNILDKWIWGENEEDTEEFNAAMEAKNKITSRGILSSQTTNMANDATDISENKVKLTGQKGNTYNYNMAQDYLTTARDKAMSNNWSLQKNTSAYNLDGGDLPKTESGQRVGLDGRIGMAKDASQLRREEVYKEANGFFPQQYAQVVSTKTPEGKHLANIINGKNTLNGDAVKITGESITIQRNNADGTITISAPVGTSLAKSEVKTYTLSPNEVPSSLAKIAQPSTYTPVYDARNSGAKPITVKTTMFRSNQEKIDYYKNTGTPMSTKLYSDSEFRKELEESIPPQYKEAYFKKYGGAIEFIINNPTSISLEPINSYYVQTWKIGDVMVDFKPTGLQNITTDQAAQIKNNGQNDYTNTIRKILGDFNGVNSPILDIINENINANNQR